MYVKYIQEISTDDLTLIQLENRVLHYFFITSHSNSFVT